MSAVAKELSEKNRPVSGKVDLISPGFSYCLALAAAFYIVTSTTAYAGGEAANRFSKEPEVIFTREPRNGC
jgi:hypothetical protein